MGEGLVLGIKADQFAVVAMADGRLRATRITQVWAPGESVSYCGHDHGPASCQMVSLEGLCLTWSSSIIRVLGSELEAKVFGLEQEIEDLRVELLRERGAHARSRDRLRLVRLALTSASTVLREKS